VTLFVYLLIFLVVLGIELWAGALPLEPHFQIFVLYLSDRIVYFFLRPALDCDPTTYTSQVTGL
jgi:hypothetical protein